MSIFKIGLVLILFTLVFMSRARATYAREDYADESSYLSQSGYSSDDVIKSLAIKKVLTKYNSPLADHSDSFINASKIYVLDCYLVPSISGVESTFGRFMIPGTHNPFGWGKGTIAFKSWDEGINTVSHSLRKNYIDRGAENLSSIARIYDPPGHGSWANHVDFFMKEFYNEELKVRRMAEFL